MTDPDATSVATTDGAVAPPVDSAPPPPPSETPASVAEAVSAMAAAPSNGAAPPADAQPAPALAGATTLLGNVAPPEVAADPAPGAPLDSTGKTGPASPYDLYKVASSGSSGQYITLILGRGAHHIIYEGQITVKQDGREHTTNDVYIEYQSEMEKSVAPLISEFGHLRILAESRLVGRDRAFALRHVGRSLHAAILLGATSPAGHFDQARAFITTKADQRARLWFLGGAVSSAILFAAAILIENWLFPPRVDLQPLWSGALAGLLGGTLASLIRGPDLQVDPFSEDSYVVSQGVIRTLLSAGFGALAVMFLKSKLLLGDLPTTGAVPMAIAVMAGFSQRFVPELLGTMEGRFTKKVEPPTKTSETVPQPDAKPQAQNGGETANEKPPA